jgi:YVTN family beta-propeller protein
MFGPRPLYRKPATGLLPLLLASALLAPPALAAPGDVNADAAVDVRDALLVLRAAVELDTLTPGQIAAADVAPRPGAEGRLVGDGKTDVQDAIRILQDIVGLLSPADLAPAEPLTLYTLNAGDQCRDNPSVTAVDLTRYFTSPNDSVTLNAFTPGSTPNHMVVRGDTGYLANSGSNTLQIIDLKANAITGTVEIGAGTNPFQVALVGEKAYVSLLISNEVAVVDLNTRQVTKSIPVGTGPTGIVAAGGKVYVGNSGFVWNPDTSSGSYDPGTVSVIDPATDAVVNTLNVAINPQDIAVDLQGYLHVVSLGDYTPANPGKVTVINPATGQTVGTVAIGGTPGAIAITFDGKAYLADTSNGILTYDALSLQVLRGPDQAVKVNPQAWDLATDARGRVYVAQLDPAIGKVTVLDSRTDAVVTEIGVGPCAEGIAVR